jgi:ubiquinone/menaquinone biosynthesis C-methylase UbiE
MDGLDDGKINQMTNPSFEASQPDAPAVADQAAFFDSRAESWEETCYPPAVRERLQALIARFKVRDGERVLDLGTGPGVLIPYLKRRLGENGGLCAVDISYRMVRLARQKRLSPKDLVLRADAHRLPFKTGTFHRTICFAAFPHFHDPAAALGEMSRVTVAGGAVLVAHLMSRRELTAHHAAHSPVAKDVLPDAPEMTQLFADAGLSLPDIMDAPGMYLAVGLVLNHTRTLP